MTDHSSQSSSLDIFGALPNELERTVTDIGWPKFRARQVLEWVYARLVTDPELMTNLARDHRARIATLLRFHTAAITRTQLSQDGTIKLLLTWPDGAQAETVMIPDGARRTACVSSQVGCPVGCRFCASGLDGVKGNLSAAQIVEQIFQLNRFMAQRDPATQPLNVTGMTSTGRAPSSPGRDPDSSPSRRITNIVFMGMGEPLANYANVMRAVRIIHDPACFNIGARKITLSTVGVPPRIRELADESLPLNLALSLHAPTEALRRELIPWANHFKLDDILDACRYYFDRTGREITLEYILLAGVNDRPEHARQLAKLCKSIRANVNLIRYNEVQGLPYRRPESPDVMNFQNILRQAKVNAHVRKSRGRDIDAACGQLRRNSSDMVRIGEQS